MENFKVAVCGLGNMGLQVALRVAKAEAPVCFDISEGARSGAKAEGLTVAETLSEVADSDIVVLSLPHSQASLSTVRELAKILKPGALVLETSTVAPSDILEMAAILESGQIRIVDAAIVTGVVAMAAGTTSLLVGDLEESASNAMVKVLSSISTNITWTGQLGSAMALKVIHNAVAHATMVTLAEARGSSRPRPGLRHHRGGSR